MSNGDKASGCLGQGVPVYPKPEDAPVPCSALPGVIETVPLAGDGVLAVGSVVSPHCGARVVGDGIEVINGVVCGEQEWYSAFLAAALVPPNMPAQSCGQKGPAQWTSVVPTPPASAPYCRLQHPEGCKEYS